MGLCHQMVFPISPWGAWVGQAPQLCSSAKNNSSHNFMESSNKTILGFFVSKVKVKGYRLLANSSASCLNWNSLNPPRGVGRRGKKHLWEAHTCVSLIRSQRTEGRLSEHESKKVLFYTGEIYWVKKSNVPWILFTNLKHSGETVVLSTIKRWWQW